MRVFISLSKETVKVTFTLKNLTDEFYNGGGVTGGRVTEHGLLNMSDAEKFKVLMDYSFGDLRHAISMKIGTGNAFKDRVALNSVLRRNPTFEFSLGDRKGYKLATFIITG